MKKIIAIVVAIIMLIVLGSCGTATEEKKETNSIKAEKKIINVEVTLPATFLDGEELELTDEMKEIGVKKITQNEDGSATILMSKNAHKEMLRQYKEGIDEGITEILGDKENYPSFDSITYNDDLSEVNIKVDAAKYGGFEFMAAIVFYMQGGFYQSLSGVPQEELQTVVNFIDKDTSEVIETGNLQEFMNASTESEMSD